MLSILIGLVSSLFTTATRAQVDTLFRFNADQRILKLWQSAPFYPVGSPPYPTYTDSTALFAQYDKLARFARKQDDERLYWYVQLHKLLLRNSFRDGATGQSTLLTEAQPVFDACPVPVVQASYWYFRGRFEFGKSHFDESFQGLFRAQQAFQQIGYAHIPEISEYLYGLGDSYYFFGEDANCLTYLAASLRYPALSKRTRLAALNTMGTTYRSMRNYPAAQACFVRTRQLALASRDSAYFAIATSNLGHVLLLANRPAQALPYLYQAYALSQTSVPESAALTAIHLAKSLMLLDSTAKAKTYLDRSRRFFKNRLWSYYDLEYVQARTQYFRKAGDYRRVSAYQDTVLQIKDTLRARFNLRLLTASQAKINAERILSAQRRLEAEKATAIRVRNLILVAMVFVVLAMGYALWQNQQKRRQEKRMLLAQQQRAQQQLAHAREQLEQYMVNLQAKNQLIETISAELSQGNPYPLSSSDGELPDRSPSIERLLNRVILTELDWQQFKQLFEGVYPGFFTSLHTQLPDLTPAEIRLLALMKLDISTKQMAFMLGVNPSTIRTSQYRLRRKLDERPGATDLPGLLEQL